MTSPRKEICIGNLKLNKWGGQSGPREKFGGPESIMGIRKGRRPGPLRWTLREYERCSTGLSGGRELSKTLHEAATKGV